MLHQAPRLDGSVLDRHVAALKCPTAGEFAHGVEAKGCLGDVSYAGKFFVLSCVAVLVLLVALGASLWFALPNHWGPGS